MNSPLQGNANEMSVRLEFTRNLNQVTNKIHATSNIDEIMLDVSRDICTLFNADRLTIYVVGDDKASLISKVKTGLNSFKDLKLPIAEQSIAGYSAAHKKLLNIKDVYDLQELAAHSGTLRFLQDVDKRTGYRTKQMLVAPVVDEDGELVGVMQVINNRAGQPFPAMVEEGVKELAQTLAVALRQRQQQSDAIKTKYDYLVADAVMSAAEFDLATRTARRKGVDIEDVLIDEFNIKLDALGSALSKYFNVPYEPFRTDRVKPSELLRNLRREYVESSHWVPVDDTPEGLVILTTDPERIQASRVVNNIFPKNRLIYKVCTQREFKSTLDAFYGGGGVGDITGSFGDSSESMDDLLTSLGCRGLGRLIVQVFEFVFSDLDDVVVLQEMLHRRRAINQRAVGAVHILEERVVEDGDHGCVLAAHRQIADHNVIVRLAPDGDALLVQRIFLDHRPVHAQYQFCRHLNFPVITLINF